MFIWFCFPTTIIPFFLFLSADILLPSPCWTTYAPQCKLAGKSAIVVDTDFASEWKVTPAEIAKALDKRGGDAAAMIVLNNPGNPCQFAEGGIVFFLVGERSTNVSHSLLQLEPPTPRRS